jgi:hypothetical protein
MRKIIILTMLAILPLACGNKSTNTNNGISVSISPRRQIVALDSTQLFTAVVYGNSDQRVTWELAGDSTFGTISVLGLYRAPHVEPNVDSIKISAQSVADLSGIGNAWIFLHDPAILYVDTSGHDDTLSGSLGHPYRTITYALNGAVNASVVHTVSVGPGVYDQLHGETFPLSPRSGLILRGAGMNLTSIIGPGGANQPANAVIALDGTYDITVDSLHLSTIDSSGIGIWLRRAINITINKNQISRCNYGIKTDSTLIISIFENNIIKNNFIGISVNGFCAPVIRGCHISNCYTNGIEIVGHAMPDLGTRDTSFFAGNDTIDFGQLTPQGRWLIYNLHPYLPGADTIWAIHNTWQSQNLDDNYQYIYDHRRDTTVCAVMLSRP